MFYQEDLAGKLNSDGEGLSMDVGDNQPHQWNTPFSDDGAHTQPVFIVVSSLPSDWFLTLQRFIVTFEAVSNAMAKLPALVVVYILNTKTVSYIDVSALALYVWDYLITFQMELDLVWNSKWTLMKYLFLVQRYLPFVDVVVLIPYRTLGVNMTPLYCYRFYQALGWMMLSGTFLSELLLALRVWAVWGRTKWSTIILALSLAAFWAPTYFILYRFLQPLRFGNAPYPGYHGCTLLEAKNSLFLCYLTIMIWNIGTLIFVLIPGLRAYNAGGNSALFHVVYRDGVMYYLYLVGLSFLNVLAIRTFPLGAEYLLLSIQRCLHTILASRMLLHIRYHVQNETEVISSEMAYHALEHHSGKLEANINNYDIRVAHPLGTRSHTHTHTELVRDHDERNYDLEGKLKAPMSWR